MEFDFEFDFKKSPAYRSACEWHSSFIQERQTDFVEEKLEYWKEIYEYAKSRYEEVLKARNAVEDKADSLLKFVGTIAGGLLAFFKVTGTLDTLGWRIYPSLICFCLSAIFCLFVRRTAAWPSPTDMPILTNYKCGRVELLALLSASLHCSIEGGKWVVSTKARLVQIATSVAIIGLACLALLFAGAS